MQVARLLNKFVSQLKTRFSHPLNADLCISLAWVCVTFQYAVGQSGRAVIKIPHLSSDSGYPEFYTKSKFRPEFELYRKFDNIMAGWVIKLGMQFIFLLFHLNKIRMSQIVRFQC